MIRTLDANYLSTSHLPPSTSLQIIGPLALRVSPPGCMTWVLTRPPNEFQNIAQIESMHPDYPAQSAPSTTSLTRAEQFQLMTTAQGLLSAA